MAEDWRITATLPSVDDVAPLVRVLHEHRADHELPLPSGERVAVSAADDKVFLYADGRLAAEQAESTLRELAQRQGLSPALQLDRWHPVEERWEDASVAEPETAATRAAEHERLEAEETAESQSTGVAAWEVRVEFETHREAAEFGREQEDAGQPVVRRWRFVLIGANDEDDANALAERLRGQLPASATIHVEPGSGAGWEFMPEQPFAVFGGLAG